MVPSRNIAPSTVCPTANVKLLPLVTCLLLPTSFLAEGAAARKPNIIYVLADDLGWTDLGVQGSRYYETPNIDKLASEGARLTRYHNCQNCQPTRAALMTGQYGARTGVYTVGGIDRFDWKSRPLVPVQNTTKLPLDKTTIAQALKTAGYATGMFGKWHLGEDADYHPKRRGFDEAIVSMGVHFDFQTNPRTDYPKGQYLADFLTEKAEHFIRAHKDEPFFLYLPHFGVHAPHEAKPNWVEHFKTKQGEGGHKNPVYAAMIASVDESVGRLMGLLDELQLSKNTVFVFSSDNGGVGGYQREGLAKGGDGSITDNAPLRSGKGSLYEGGTRVPFIMRWPGVIQPGSTSDVPAIHVDVYPTLLEIASAEAPKNQPLDGASLLPILRGPSGSLVREAIFQHFPGYLGMGPGKWRTTPVSLIEVGDWKLMEFLEGQVLELYNLKDDIGETKNLAALMPEKTAELHSKLVAWRDEISAPMPKPNAKVESEKPRKANRKN
jgi:arylsulfatase A-like enzyme